ncbi:DUF3143 domain-containing protein [Synechococcales cyanobacterium C]|uniref:DUF3143 domain-containing protein n=1 Tax=Petrachloros mirabilis ULC683 TaxID=2781853 RepID=A0A8K2AGX5_9CYAN|nr:DUF3143 domain-containing protein [Petrachloros mirabilis ULC683]
MSLPVPETPLYNHRLPDIEQWLQDQGCAQDPEELHHWQIRRPSWCADLWLDIEALTVVYQPSQGADESASVKRAFKYSLSRQDVEDAIFSGP